MLKLKSTILSAALVFALGGTIGNGFAADKDGDKKTDVSMRKSRLRISSVLPKEKREAIHFWTRLSGAAAAEGKSIDEYFKNAKEEWESFVKSHPKVSEVMVKHSEEMAKLRKERTDAKEKNMSRDERRRFAQEMRAKMLEIKKRHRAEIHTAIEQEKAKEK